MKKLYPKSKDTAFKLCLILMTGLIAVIYSCKKDVFNSTSPPDQKEQSAFVEEAKGWFERNTVIHKEQSLATNAVGGNKRKWNDALKPDWGKTTVYSKNKGTIIEMPLFSSAVSFLMNTTDGSRATQQNNYTKATYIIQKDSAGVFKGWFMVLVADTAYVNGDFTKLGKNTYRSKDPTYSGRLLYYDLNGKFLAGWKYDNGAITNTLSVADQIVNQQQINSQRIKVNLVQTCETYAFTTVTWECIAVNFNNSNPDWIPTCTPYYTTTYLTQCTTQPGGGDSGGGGTGGGGSGPGTFPPPPPQPDCPTLGIASVGGGQHINLLPGGGGTPPTVPDDPCALTPPEDPCAKMKREKQKFSNDFNTQRNAAIQAKPGPNEYGSDLRLTSPTSNTFVNTPITTNNTVGSWPPTFTWNSTDGYTIGSAHRHPGGSAPSPDDVFSLMDNLTNPLLTNAGASSISAYKKNAYITVTTSTGTFVVTVNNWGTLASLYGTFNNDPTSFDTNYQNIAGDYRNLTGVDDGTATAYALNKIFGDAISMYKAPLGTTNYAIAGIDANGNLILVPCP